MANTTVRGAISIHGTNPQYLIEKVIRARVYDSIYWKEHCFALNAASLIDNAIKLTHVGGTYANTRPTEFMCLCLKLLQLQPEREIILEYLRADEFKYLRALAAFYVRLTFDPVNVYEVLEPLLDDYRKIRFRNMNGSYSITTIDEFADQLLNEERVCEIQLPRLTQRKVLEETEGLLPRRSKLGRALGVDVDQDQERDDDEGDRYVSDSDHDSQTSQQRYMSKSPSVSPSQSPVASHTPEYYTEEEVEDDSDDDNQTKPVTKVNHDDTASRGERFVSRSPTQSPEPNSMSMQVDMERIKGDV
ncbi:hypothetical protein OIO90_000654 [Microbotryomycetes sp. JL221]|nr:hypothetical protein OIO90_000654 [Microbotryomycetes sp. JL221]